MTVVVFTSSDGFLEIEPDAQERVEIEVFDYIEGTYNSLRTGPSGDEIAWYKDGGWELLDGRRFSDWAVRLP